MLLSVRTCWVPSECLLCRPTPKPTVACGPPPPPTPTSAPLGTVAHRRRRRCRRGALVAPEKVAAARPRPSSPPLCGTNCRGEASAAATQDAAATAAAQTTLRRHRAPRPGAGGGGDAHCSRRGGGAQPLAGADRSAPGRGGPCGPHGFGGTRGGGGGDAVIEIVPPALHRLQDALPRRRR